MVQPHEPDTEQRSARPILRWTWPMSLVLVAGLAIVGTWAFRDARDAPAETDDYCQQAHEYDLAERAFNQMILVDVAEAMPTDLRVDLASVYVHHTMLMARAAPPEVREAWEELAQQRLRIFQAWDEFEFDPAWPFEGAQRAGFELTPGGYQPQEVYNQVGDYTRDRCFSHFVVYPYRPIDP